MMELVDDQVLHAFTRAELDSPAPRKLVEGKPVYLSRWFERPRQWGVSVLSDFGSAVRGDMERNHDAQPNVYRSPEVMLKVEWSYPVDIWNVGCMVRPSLFALHRFATLC
jgi:serine/threonine protein kinase